MLSVDRWWLKEVWYAPVLLENCSTRLPLSAPGITRSPSKRICRGKLSQTSPRMGHTLGEIFTHAQSLNFKNRNSWAGRADSVLVDHPCAAASRASPSPISAGCCLQAALESFETTASGSTGKEDLKADRRVRYYKEVGRPEWLLAGRATVPRGIWYRSLHVSSSANDSLKKFTGARSRRHHHSHFSHG